MTTQKPLVTLPEWAKLRYADAAPCVNTLRKWARDALIQPAPQRHGRAYYVDPDAHYTPPTKRRPAGSRRNTNA